MVHGVRVVGIDVVGHQIDVIEIGDRFAQLRYLEIPGFAARRNGQGTVPLQLIQLLPQRFQQQSVPVPFGGVAVYRGVFPVDVQAVKAVSFHGTGQVDRQGPDVRLGAGARRKSAVFTAGGGEDQTNAGIHTADVRHSF